MELGGVVAMDGLVDGCSDVGGGMSSPFPTSEVELSRERGFLGSSLSKHGREGMGAEEHDWRFLKMARTEPMLALPTKAAPLWLGSNSNCHPLFPDGEQMLSFTPSTKPDTMMVNSDGTLPYYHHLSSSSSTHSYLRNEGLSSGGLDANMHGALTRVRGPFTPTQWIELEHQALIYKYIVANVPIPSSLLTPLRRSINSYGFPPSSAGYFGSGTWGWGSFHLGYSGNGDPEPGRCRRTDGKKWRCSRDAVADQKYCERHMNRGRHRSRKHVEGQSGHAAKAVPVIATSQSASSLTGGRSSTNLPASEQQTKNLATNMTDPCPAQFNRIMMNKENVKDHVQDSQNLSLLTSTTPKSIDTPFPTSKLHNPFEETNSKADIGHISSNSFVNSPKNCSEHMNFIPSSEFNEQPESHSLRHFIDDWPKNHSDCSAVTWPMVEEMHSDRTQLSISVPIASSDFSSSSSSPYHEKQTLSPLRLSRGLDSIQMGLGVGSSPSDQQASWLPIFRGASMGGPLGEALTNTNAPKDENKNCSASSLNFLKDRWDLSLPLESSPTGVLQKTTFGSLSSSTGSSPRLESHKAHDSICSMFDDLGSTLVNHPTIPSLLEDDGKF
ncbi:growth-regulating factor 6-like isoform X2 [Typha angustifolia]|uniref:growth-regulating factor 6-like isoform X2 n=1 Tax=Typha angustifolia TaxID=59011 RepID=UPI003C2C1603